MSGSVSVSPAIAFLSAGDYNTAKKKGTVLPGQNLRWLNPNFLGDMRRVLCYPDIWDAPPEMLQGLSSRAQRSDLSMMDWGLPLRGLVTGVAVLRPSGSQRQD
jgi:hypothetical protein